MNKILVIDGSSLFFRAFYAFPLLKTKRGNYTNAIYGFIMMLENAIEKIKPDMAVVCFDMKGKTFRSDIYKDYKGTRSKTPSELEQQFPIVREILNLMNIKVLESEIYEADDIAGTIAKKASELNMECFLLTGDRDYFQLVNDNTKVLFTKKGITEMDIVSVESIEKDYGIEPKDFIEIKALMGDSSDNIPGVKGIGEKTALKLIKEYKTLENLYDNIESISGKKLKENLENEKSIAFMSKKLGTIVTNVPIDNAIEDFKIVDYDYVNLSNLYREYEFNSLLTRLPEEYQKEDIVKSDDEMFNYSFVTLGDIKDYLSKAKSFYFRFISDGKIYEGINPDYLAIKIDDKDVLIAKIDNNEDILSLRDFFERKDIKKFGHNLKEDIIILKFLGIEINGYVYDSEIAEYILNSTISNYDINNISINRLKFGYKSIEELLGKGSKAKLYSEIEVEEVGKYFAFYLNTCAMLKSIHLDMIKEEEMDELYFKVELPLIEVLASMEVIGIKTDKSVLDEIGNDLDEKLRDLERKIYDEAGEEFNINSTKQLGVILFDKLDFPIIKKTKTGYSTAIDVLEKLIGKGDIIKYIIDYRKFSKLKSTYVDGLKDLINENTGKIHSRFNQTVASTGRISSTEPNLQNIPIKTDEGKLIRKAFLSSENSILVDADYSQIELRVLASISNDENMIKAFKEDDDIHKRTASEVFKVPIDEVDSVLRYRAKAVNFGIVYGISDYGLSQNLNIPRKVAGEYINDYLTHYQGIRDYMENEVKKAKEKGYVETILHRRRYIPELSAKNFNIRSFGERIAFNTPIQGSAADIIKIAMVNVYNALKEKKLKSTLILQIHDELVVNATEDELDIIKDLMKSIMEDAVELNVPLKIDMQVGNSLYDTK